MRRFSSLVLCAAAGAAAAGSTCPAAETRRSRVVDDSAAALTVIDDFLDAETVRHLAASVEAGRSAVVVSRDVSSRLRRVLRGDDDDVDAAAAAAAADANQSMPCAVRRGPMAEHVDSTPDGSENEWTAVLYLRDAADAALRIVDSQDSGNVANVGVRAGRAVVFDNKRVSHSVEAPEWSARAMLGPVTWTSRGGFASVGIVNPATPAPTFETPPPTVPPTFETPPPTFETRRVLSATATCTSDDDCPDQQQCAFFDEPPPQRQRLRRLQQLDLGIGTCVDEVN
mmetsp:Transcript_29652/g.90727  ORF Transcript_29652/g.90727 Transcript_29652/m.90727 type:complete len:284 (+) Transcript_29652:437-1288(+)|eukprot:CAMPEP_0198661510 /NCGR_PEP_ID=MMETSP1467-20131203/42202_1 /TAXON_ID=1462469 /ORGANISM="unid. sp., Strain CCMP2135" /LENGTH=283 /DNA_ID=CAMNT_0044397949 /DNA_START=396 /DNA_END=1247 /DNA_ORIENTATION=+